MTRPGNARPAESRFFPCWVTGHTLACVLAIAVGLNVLVRFRKNLVEMRIGKSPFSKMLETTPITAFSNASTPALGGMVRGCPWRFM